MLDSGSPPAGGSPESDVTGGAHGRTAEEFRVECATRIADLASAAMDLQQGLFADALATLRGALSELRGGASGVGWGTLAGALGDLLSALDAAERDGIDGEVLADPVMDALGVFGRLTEEEPEASGESREAIASLRERLRAATTKKVAPAQTPSPRPAAQPAAQVLTPRQRALIRKFVATTDERVSTISRLLCDLERQYDEDAANEMMREIHTLKGECRVMGFGPESDVAHEIEDELVAARKNQFKIEPAQLDKILERLRALNQQLGAAGGVAVSVPPAAPRPATPGPAMAEQAADAKAAQPRKRVETFVRVANEQLKDLTDIGGDLMLHHQQRERSVADIERLARNSLSAIERIIEANQTEDRDGARRAQQTIEGLRAMSALCREMLSTVARINEDGFHYGFRLTKLQDSIRHMRLLGLATVFEQYPLAVREMARDLGKEIAVIVEGGEVCVDKTVLDRLDDVLLHLLRNSVDHGLEEPAQRLASGKSQRGTIWLSARQFNDQVEISVRDDGRGIDPERVKEVAVRKGLLSDVEAASLSREAAIELIFRPGFSTREQASDLSGRGVGTDVVKQRIEALGGTVRVTTDVGRGTTFALTIPISVALTDVIVVQSGGGLYGLATSAIVAVARALPSERVQAGNGLALRIGSELISTIGLHSMLGVEGAPESADELGEYVVVKHGERTLCVQVDRVLGQRLVLQRALDPFVSSLKLLSAAVSLDGDRLALVLNVPELFQIALRNDFSISHAGRVAGADAKARTRRRIMIVDDSEITRDTLLTLTARLGYETVEAINGKDALDQLTNKTVDLVLTDLDMPIMDGFGLIKAIRSRPSLAKLPVIVLSTRRAAEDQQRARDAGANGYLVKALFKESELEGFLAPFFRGKSP